MSDLPTDPREIARRTYYKREKNGSLVAYDMITGAIIARDDSHGKEVELAATSNKYHPVLLDTICDRMSETGRSLHSVCGDSDMPKVSTVLRWQMNIPEVKDKINLARHLIAEYLHDKILDSLESTAITRDDVQVEKLKFDKLKYLAGVNNPEIYGNKTTIAGDGAAPIQFVISTGIDRGTDEQSRESAGRDGEFCSDEGDAEGKRLKGAAGNDSETKEDDSVTEGRKESGFRQSTNT